MTGCSSLRGAWKGRGSSGDFPVRSCLQWDILSVVPGFQRRGMVSVSENAFEGVLQPLSEGEWIFILVAAYLGNYPESRTSMCCKA